MTMKESYVDAVEWLSKDERNRILIKVRTEKELDKYKEYFKEQMNEDLFVETKLYDSIEWKVEPTLDK